MNILSLFDGISCGNLALQRAGFTNYRYYASEIDDIAKKITKKRFPDTISFGDVRHVKKHQLPDIDLLIGGSPCQSFSIAGKKEGLKSEEGNLIFEFFRLLQECKPKYFMFENVASMQKEVKDFISRELGEPLIINSSRVSAQNRIRLYWSNIPCNELPPDKHISFRDILNVRYPENYTICSYHSKKVKNNRRGSKNNHKDYSFVKHDKSFCLTSVPCNHALFSLKNNTMYRHLQSIELERLQTLPDDYTYLKINNKPIGDRKRLKMIANAWTVDVVAFILSFIS